MSSALKAIFAIAAMGCVLSATPSAHIFAHDGHDHDDENEVITPVRDSDNPNITQFQYKLEINDSPDFNLKMVLDSMQPTFKGTAADRTHPYLINPTLNIAQYDLNGDHHLEIIAVPIENTEDEFCGGNILRCVHYILDDSNGEMKVLGAIPAFAIDRGDEIKNGYWTLKVFKDNLLPELNPQVEIYAFDKEKQTYMELQPK